MKITSQIRKISRRRHDSVVLYRLLRASGALFTIFLIGIIGYYNLAAYYFGPDEYSVLDAAFMTVITLTTIGYTEAIPVQGNVGMELFTIVLIFFGMGMMFYFVSSLTAFVVEGELFDLVKKQRMSRRIENLDRHFVLAGVGNTGSHVLPEILSSHRDCVVVDRDRERLLELLEEVDEQVPYIVGDATDDATLVEAGIERAAGVVFSLGNDRDNLFATITARRINSELYIVTRGEDPRSEMKFRMAGATSVIYTNVLGGMRMAAEVLRPEVTSFLDLMMQDHEHFRRIEELPVPDDSPLIGHKIREIPIRQHSDAIIIAVYDAEEDDYKFNPGPDFVIPPNSKLIVLALIGDIPRLEHLIAHGDTEW